MWRRRSPLDDDGKPLKRRNGNQHLHRESLKYRNAVKRKLHAYHVFMQAGVVAQGLLQYLSVVFPALIWNSFVAHGCGRSDRASRRRSWSSLTHCAIACPNFS